MGCHACCVLGKKRRGRTLLAVFLLVALVLLILLLVVTLVLVTLILVALVLVIFTVVLHEEHLLSAWLRTGLLLTVPQENIQKKSSLEKKGKNGCFLTNSKL